MIIKENELIDLLVKEFPGFKSHLDPFIEYWDEDIGITIKMMPFSDYIIDIIKAKDDNEIKRIFDLVEYLTIHGDESVQNAMTTALLEYLLIADPKEIQFKKFAHHLGKESVEYCKAWNKVCGCTTEGIDY